MPILKINGALHYFAHVPKCAGQAIEQYMREQGMQLAWIDNYFHERVLSHSWTASSPQHAPWAEVTRLIPESWFETSFAVVRHPLRRFASAYNHRLFARNPVARIPALTDCATWWRHFERLRDGAPFLLDNHLRRQIDFVPEGATIFRFEDGLDPVARHIDGLLGLSSGKAIPVKDSGAKRVFGHADKVRVPEALQRRMIAYYKPDFEAFGYDPEPIEDLTVYRRLPPKLSDWRATARRLRALWPLLMREGAVGRARLVRRFDLDAPPGR